jgi:NADH:ubiquinone oxidoreductase subunit F (NADH-binding)
VSAPVGLPRLLAGIPAVGALSLDEHLALHGELPLFAEHGRRGSAALVELVEAAGLRGRGGAGFPTATKLRAVADGARAPRGAPRDRLDRGLPRHRHAAARRGAPPAPRRGPPIVVLNGAEGEPASAKDRTLLRTLPHLVLDGAQLAAAAVGAREILVGVCRPSSDRSTPGAFAATARAIAERERAPRGIWGRRPSPRSKFRLLAVPNRYVAGQESALVNHLDGGPALPTFAPPRPFEQGVRGRPTLVCNVETLAQLALIARHGAAWFRELGVPEQPGSALVTLSGPLLHPGVYELEYGSPLAALIDAAGGATAPLRAALLGGYCGTWIDAELLREVALCDSHLARYGATLGAGIVVLLSTAVCPVAELARITRWLAAQSTRQCGPCVFGLDAIAAVFEQLAAGGCDGGQVAIAQRLRALAGLVSHRGACGHPDGAARLVASALEVFAEELADHARYGPCDACGSSTPSLVSA